MECMSELDSTRIIGLEGTYNTRDLGGFKTAGGETVKRGLVFRSDELSGLTDKDVELIGDLGIKTVVDFRSKAEIKRSRSRLPGNADILELNIDCGDLGVGLTLVDEKNGPKMMETVNRSLVKDSGLIFKEFFSLLTRPDSLPLLFHCTAGKDRTGFAAALFLSALGVRRGDIFRDYLLSSVGARKKFGLLVEKMPRLISIVTVRPGYLEAAFDEIERNFCSVENYLVKELEVDLDKLRYIFAA